MTAIQYVRMLRCKPCVKCDLSYTRGFFIAITYLIGLVQHKSCSVLALQTSDCVEGRAGCMEDHIPHSCNSDMYVCAYKRTLADANIICTLLVPVIRS